MKRPAQDVKGKIKAFHACSQCPEESNKVRPLFTGGPRESEAVLRGQQGSCPRSRGNVAKQLYFRFLRKEPKRNCGHYLLAARAAQYARGGVSTEADDRVRG